VFDDHIIDTQIEECFHGSNGRIRGKAAARDLEGVNFLLHGCSLRERTTPEFVVGFRNKKIDFQAFWAGKKPGRGIEASHSHA